jgi:hypothetical protein
MMRRTDPGGAWVVYLMLIITSYLGAVKPF